MVRIDDELRDRIRSAVDMVELMRNQVQMTRRGNRWWGRCPFHEERTPSFSLIPPESQRYYCQGCGATGDCFTWAMEKEGAADFGQAVQLLAERYGIPLPDEGSPADQRARAALARRDELLDRAATYYANRLWNAEEAAPARDYLLGRGFTEDVLKRFRVGYAPASGTALARAARRQGFSRDELVDAGLARSGAGGVRDFFVSRITFPIANASGKVRGFGARTLDPNERAKYVNSPEGPLFKKRDLIFGLPLARAAAAKQRWIVVAEGYTDVLAFVQAGVENAVACMGTSLTTEQLKLLARYVDVVRLSFDADEAGRRAAMRSLEAARGVRGTIRMEALTLPSGQDPGDFASSPEAQAALGTIVGNSEPLVPCLIRYTVRYADPSATGRERALQEVVEMLRQLPDSVEKDEGVRVAVSELKLSRGAEERLWEESRHRAGRVEQQPSARPILGPQDGLERNLLALAMASGPAGAAELAGVWPEAFRVEAHRRAHDLLARGVEGPDAWPEDLRPLWADVAVLAAEIDGGERALREAVYRVQLPALERRAGELAEKGEEKGYLEVLALIRRLKAATRGEA